MAETQPKFNIAILKDVMVPMRDGIKLATDIYRPSDDGALLPGPFPTVLVRTSYDKAAQRYVEIANFFTIRGYVTVLQDLRGRYRSEGTGQYFHTANINEGADGYDAVEWIAAQLWSNGRIATIGSSHAAMVQTHMALYRPPHLTAIWPDVAPINSYDHQVRRGGAMQLHMFGALFLHAQDAQEIEHDSVAKQSIFNAMEHMRDLVFSTPFKPGQTPLAVVPNLEKVLFDYYYRGDYDEFWSAEYNDFERYFDRHADIPGTYSGGWYDPYAIATTRYYSAMSEKNSTPQRLIMGPWTHMGMRADGVTYSGDVDFGAASSWGTERYFEEHLEWFDRWLKDEQNGIDNEPPVRIFVMGGGDGRRTQQGKMSHGGQWRTEYEWPLARTRATPFYLHAGGALSAESPTTTGESMRFAFDPSHPVPTIGGTVTGFFEMAQLDQVLDPFWIKYLPPWSRMRSIIMDGAVHQKEEPGIVAAKPPYLSLAVRPDVLVFQTIPLDYDLEVTGNIVVKLWVSSSAVDTDFTAKLIDVYPPNEDYPAGYHMNLVDSIIRTRYRNGWEKPELMEPNKIYPLQIDLPPTSNLFKAGHRIRVDISSSNFPRFDVNPNTGEPLGRHTHRVVASNIVYFDEEHPSHVLLPQIPPQRP
jgi:putative CocE/NonD family hydrolase